MTKWEIYKNKKSGERIIVQYDSSGKPTYIALFSEDDQEQFLLIRKTLISGLRLDVLEITHNLMNYIWFDAYDFLEELKTTRYIILEDDKYDYELIKQYFDSIDDSMV